MFNKSQSKKEFKEKVEDKSLGYKFEYGKFTYMSSSLTASGEINLPISQKKSFENLQIIDQSKVSNSKESGSLNVSKDLDYPLDVAMF